MHRFYMPHAQQPAVLEYNFDLYELMPISSITENVYTSSSFHHWKTKSSKGTHALQSALSYTVCYTLFQGLQSWFEKRETIQV